MTNDYSILCVDDEQSILKSIKRSFFNKEISIALVSSGKDALNYLQNHKIDLVISDYMMPGMSGFELFLEIKKRYPGIIRVMLSGYVEKDVILKTLFDYTSISFFTKPWDEDILTDRLWELYVLKKSVKNDRLWKLINNGFPIPSRDIYINNLKPITKPDKEKNSLESFMKRDLFLYLKLLHLANSYYLNDMNIWDISDLMDISGENYIYDTVIHDTVYSNSAVMFLFHHISMLIDYYPELYGVLFENAPPPLPQYINLVNLDKLVLLSLSPDLFWNSTGVLKNRAGNTIINKSFIELIRLLFKLWHLPDEILQFYTDFKSSTPKNHMVVTLKYLDKMVLDVLTKRKNYTVPTWWKKDEEDYNKLMNKMEQSMM